MIDWFLPKGFNEHEVVSNRILTYFMLFSAILCISITGIRQFITIDDTPFFSIACLNAVLLILFKYTGARGVIGNLFISIWVISLVPMSLQTGGIYSMDFYSLLLIPLIGIALLDYKSGLFWLVAFFCYSFYLWGIIDSPEKNEFFRNQTLVFGKDYYLAGTLILSIFFTGIFSVFYFQNKNLIKKLQAQQQDLIEKNALLKKQSTLLITTQEELTRSNIELQEYAYATSHDLKQPIRTVNSFATILQKHLDKKNNLDSRSEEMLQFIIRGTDKMSRVVTDILDFAILKLGKEVSFKEIDLQHLVEIIELDLKKQIEESGAIILKENLPVVEVVPVKINQLFQNLISNAIKFRKKGTPLVITINAEDRKDYWQFTIKDNGIGIPEEYLKEIFKPFKKLHSNAEYEGSGIGLASCKYIVSLHHGEIFVASTLGEGATFYFTIPKKQSVIAQKTDLGTGKIRLQKEVAN